MVRNFIRSIFHRKKSTRSEGALHLVKKYIITSEDEDIIPDAITSDDLKILSQPDTEEYLQMIQRLRSASMEDLFSPIDEESLDNYDKTLKNL